jgi:hypothetical protein
MTIYKLAIAAFFFTLAAPGWTQTSPEDHAAHHSATAAPTGAPMPSDLDLAQSRSLIEKAEQAKTATERERLLSEHLAAMRNLLGALKSGKCSMEKMADGEMAVNSADGSKSGMMKEGMMMEGMNKDHMQMCHEKMKARSDAMADLLEQTWRREELRNSHTK